MTTFTYSPAPGASEIKTPRVRVAVFGDGYQQRTVDGINTRPRSWSLTFTRVTADIDAIEAFFVAANGADSFDWTPPKGVAGKWVCKSWSMGMPATNVQTLNATFDEVYGD